MYSLSSFTKEQLIMLLNNTALGQNYLETHFEEILELYINDFNFLLDFNFIRLLSSAFIMLTPNGFVFIRYF